MSETNGFPILIAIAVTLFLGVFAGRLVRKLRLPAIMGFIVLGVVLGPSITGIISEEFADQLGFITDLALGFVAVSIGLELSIAQLKHQGSSLIQTVMWESLTTFTVVTLSIFAVTGRLPMGIMFGAVAVTTAPAGAVAVVQETRSRGPLTRTLLAVVGFDDVAAIVVFGFALAATKYLLSVELGMTEDLSVLHSLATPIIEIGLSLVVGAAVGFAIGILNRLLGKSRDVFIITLASVFLVSGLAEIMNISLVLTAMTIGVVVINTQPRNTAEQIGEHITEVTPFMFVLFFALAGAHLDIAALPELGVVGIVYILARSFGKITGCWAGSRLGKADLKISKYLGMSILSQAGLSIGLALIAMQELAPLGEQAESIARSVIVTITASSVVFELVGPALARLGLSKAGEVQEE